MFSSKEGVYCEVKSNGSYSNESLLFSNNFSDVVFIVENERIPAHKAIITSKCEYFATMMSCGLTESTQKEIELDVPLEAFKAILQYIYTGQLVSRSEEETFKILELCRLYLMTNLLKDMETILGSNISRESVFKSTKLAKQMELKEVSKKCYKFIAENFSYFISRKQTSEMIFESWRYLLEARISSSKAENQYNRNSYRPHQGISEIEIFKQLLAWTNSNYQILDQNVLNLFKKIDLSKMNVEDIFKIVRPSKVFTEDFILDAIEKQLSQQKQNCSYCGRAYADDY